MMRPYQFECDCDGMVFAIRRAADPNSWLNDGVASLGMNRIEQAVWWVKLVMRKARTLGLWNDAIEKAEAAA